jgi:hypothetical protein
MPASGDLPGGWAGQVGLLCAAGHSADAWFAVYAAASADGDGVGRDALILAVAMVKLPSVGTHARELSPVQRRWYWVRRRYLIALFVVGIGAVAWAVVPPEIHRLKVQASKHGLAEAITAIDAVTFPRGFERIKSTKCTWYRCFYVGKPTGQVAPSLLAILGRMGVNTTQLTSTMRRQQAATDKQLRKWGLPARRSHAPLGCAVDSSVRLGPITHCALTATLDGHIVILFLVPYFVSRYSSNKHLTLADEENAIKHSSEVDISLACGYDSSPSQGETSTTACAD